MPLTVGMQLGSHEITALLGKGGMGEVYRARDLKLNREVAIKILPDEFASDPDRISPFQREAELLASLNHPNIAAIYGVEESAGRKFLVMELVPGLTLEERIKRGPIPAEETLVIAKQIVEGLEAAHEKGIIHRDLKPANVKITPDGRVKVLDFGLSKALAGETADGSLSNSPTLSIAATNAGVILGTAAYMSPEQAKGIEVDKRADIWAFGVVLFEMMSGTRLFDEPSNSETLAAVLKSEIGLQALPASCPSGLRSLIQRCLDRDPRRRLRDIGEARVAIERAEKEPEPILTTPPSSRFRGAAWIAVGALTAALITTGWTFWPKAVPLKPLIRLEVDFGQEAAFTASAAPEAVLSPDGSRLVYLSRRRLFTRRLDESKATELAGTEGAINPFFSPDGQWVAFFAKGQLSKIRLDGGGVIPLCEVSAFDTRGASWGEDGNIIAAMGSAEGLSRISSSGGARSPLTELAPGERAHRWPQVLSGGKAVLFSSSATRTGLDETAVKVISLTDRRVKTLLQGGTFARYLSSGKAPGHLVYLNHGTLFAVPFDLDKLEVQGTPIPVLEEVAYSSATGSAQFDSSKNGTLMYRSGTATGLSTIQWLDSAGKMQPLLPKSGVYQQARFSPDGQRLALVIAEGVNTDVWVYDWQRDTMARVSFGGSHGYPLWTPDGRFVLFSSRGDNSSGSGGQGLFWTRADGSSQPQQLLKSLGLLFSFAPDGKTLAFMARSSPGGHYHLWTAPIENDGSALKAGKPEAFLQTAFDERHPTISPDGRWMAYVSDDSGEFQIYVTAFPKKNGKTHISNSGGLYPQWSRTGHELFFRSQDNRIMVAAYSVNGDSFAAEKPRQWSDVQLADLPGPNYGLAADGKRIAALIPAEAAGNQLPPSHVIFLENFFDELHRRVPLVK